MATTETILPILQNFHGTEPLKQLFWVELNYDRVNTHIDNLPKSTVDLVAETPLCLATGGRDNDFHVIYVKLKTERLRKTDERQIITHLQTRYPDALYVFSNCEQDHWHFVNVKLTREKQGSTEQQRLKQRNLFRRITIAPDERLRTAAERITMLDLEELGEQDTFFDRRELLTSLEIRKGHEEAFNVEAVTKAFFENYKGVFRKLQDELDKQTNDVKWAHDYAQQFLSRCLFLYFVQRKRWLGDDIEFLHTFWDAYQNESQPADTFVEKWLNVLFFQAFNNLFHGGYTYFPTEIRQTLQLAPYLNGGLFRENELDIAYTVKVSDELWQEIFTFFEQYNFTIAEDTPLDQEVAVDPEMIGIVYESLVSEEEKEKEDAGIFYTQRVEIGLMCRLAVADNLSNHIGTEDDKHLFYEVLFAFEPEEKIEADAKLTALWEDIHKHLSEITVLDPACGSGSFLVGMLHVLDDLHERAERSLGIDSISQFERRKALIGKNLYGVDVKQWACKIAELRLWLSLIIDAEFTVAELNIRRDPLLPDFSFNIRHGDSIVQNVGGMNLSQIRSLSSGAPRALKRKIANLQTEKLKFYNNEEDRKYAEKSDVQEAEHGLFRELLQSYDIQLSKDIHAAKAWLEDPAEQLTFAGMKTPDAQQLDFETIKMQRELARNEENRAQVQRAREALSPNTTPPFVWNIAFVEIFSQRGGFDIVVENPPYTRQKNIMDLILPRDEAITTTNKKIYKAKLARSIYQAHPKFFGYQSIKDIKPDKPEAAAKQKINARSALYVYFYFHGLSLLNPKGTFCSITSNSWLDAGYGTNLQEFLLKQCYVKMVLDNSVKRSFETADVNTVICLISAPNKNRESCLQHTVRFVNFTVPFEAILDAVIFYEIETASVRDSSPEHRIHPLPQKSLLANGNDEKGEYIGDKWGGKYLRSSDIYWTILKKSKNKLVSIEPSVGKVKTVSWSRMGQNSEIMSSKDLSSKETTIPVLKSPREFDSIIIKSSDVKTRLRIDLIDEKEIVRTPLIWDDIRGERHICRFNPEMLAFTHNFHGIYLHNIDMARQICACLNSTLTWLFIETLGRRGLGGGGVRILVEDLKRTPLLVHPKHFSAEMKRDLQSVFTELTSRSVDNISKEIRKNDKDLVDVRPDRLALDAIIFDALDLTQGERDGVYEAVNQHITTRLEKAKNK